MTPERFRQIEAVFDAVADAPAEQRAEGALRRAIELNPLLRSEVAPLIEEASRLAAAP